MLLLNNLARKGLRCYHSIYNAEDGDVPEEQGQYRGYRSFSYLRGRAIRHSIEYISQICPYFTCRGVQII